MYSTRSTNIKKDRVTTSFNCLWNGFTIGVLRVRVSKVCYYYQHFGASVYSYQFWRSALSFLLQISQALQQSLKSG